MTLNFRIGGSEGKILCQSSPTVELVALLHAMARPEHHTPFENVIAQSKAEMSPSLSERIEHFSLLWETYWPRFLLPDSRDMTETFDEDLQRMAKLPETEVIENIAWTLLNRHHGIPRIVDDESLSSVRSAVLREARARGAKDLLFAYELFESPRTLYDQLLDTLAECYNTFFKAHWCRAEPYLGSERREKLEFIRNRGAHFALTSLSPSFRFLPDPDRVVVPKRSKFTIDIDIAQVGLILVPSIFGWPHLRVKDEPGCTPLIQYPAKIKEHLNMDDLHQRIEALSNTIRLRICRLLTRGPATTSRIATQLDLTPPTISRHLAILHSANLLKSSRQGRLVYYELNIEVITSFGPDMLYTLISD